MHKQLLYVVKKTKILNRQNHNNEVHVCVPGFLKTGSMRVLSFLSWFSF